MAAARTKSDLEAELERLYREGGAIGYWAKRFHQRFTRGRKEYKGGVVAIRTELMKADTKGLQFLIKEQRLDLSLERLVLNRKWTHLFNNCDRAIAKIKLALISK